MFSQALIVLAALTPFTQALPDWPTLAARKPPSTTGPVVTRPSNFQMQFNAYSSSDTCAGNNVTGMYASGHCVNLPTVAKSYTTSADVNTQQLTMNLYSLYNCTGLGKVEHLDAGDFCFSGSVRSVCIAC